MEHAQRIFYGVLSLLALLALGWGAKQGGAPGLAFGLFAFLTLGGSVVCIWERSVVRSAFSLMATFSGVAGLFLLLGADFLAMAQILIYVGGILALLLFGVMLSPPDLSERKLSRLLAGTVLIGGGVGWVAMRVSATTGTWAVTSELPEKHTHAREIGLGFLHPGQYLVPFELAAFLLTVALVAAVYIARRKKDDLQPREEI
jgi:NADH-quinone oxidoreductase subunit J